MKTTARKEVDRLQTEIERAIQHIQGINQTTSAYLAKKGCRYAINTIRQINVANQDEDMVQISEEHYESLSRRMTDAKQAIIQHQMTIGTKNAYNAITSAIETITRIAQGN